MEWWEDSANGTDRGCDTIYLRGHCHPGQGYIESASGLGKHVTATQVAERLAQSGLPKSFAGKIKCYNCNIGAWDGDKMSFAQQFADAMFKRGYTKCSYFGYLGTLSSFYKDGLWGTHKYIDDGTGQDNVILRAKDGRVKVIPNTKTKYHSLTH